MPFSGDKVLCSTSYRWTNHHFHLNYCCPLYSKEIHIRINASQKPSIIFDLSVNLDYPSAVTMMLSFFQQCRVQLINNKKGWGKDRTACLAPSHISTSWDTRAKISTQSVRLHQGVFNTVLSLEHPLPTLSPHVTPVPFTLRAPFQISCHKCSVAFSLSLTPLLPSHGSPSRYMIDIHTLMYTSVSIWS